MTEWNTVAYVCCVIRCENGAVFVTWSVDGAVFEPSVDHAMRMATAVRKCTTRSRYNVFGGQRISIANEGSP